jgi:hypothetical protein
MVMTKTKFRLGLTSLLPIILVLALLMPVLLSPAKASPEESGAISVRIAIDDPDEKDVIADMGVEIVELHDGYVIVSCTKEHIEELEAAGFDIDLLKGDQVPN